MPEESNLAGIKHEERSEILEYPVNKIGSQRGG